MDLVSRPLIEDFSHQFAAIETATLRLDVDSHIGSDVDASPQVAEFVGHQAAAVRLFAHFGAYSFGSKRSFPLVTS